jgi:hypothetical protein
VDDFTITQTRARVATVTDYLTEPPGASSMASMPFSVHQSDFIKKSKSFIFSGIFVVLRLTELITSTPETRTLPTVIANSSCVHSSYFSNS